MEDTTTVVDGATVVWPAEGEATPEALASQPSTTEAEANTPTTLAKVAAGPWAGAAISLQSDMGKNLRLIKAKFYDK